MTAKTEGDDASAIPSASALLHLPITRSLLLQCLLHADVDLRLESFEFVCSNLYLSELPSESELSLIRLSFPFVMKVSEEPSVRSKFCKQGWQRLLVRIRDSAGKLIKQGAAVDVYTTPTTTSLPLYPYDVRANPRVE